MSVVVCNQAKPVLLHLRMQILDGTIIIEKRITSKTREPIINCAIITISIYNENESLNYSCDRRSMII